MEKLNYNPEEIKNRFTLISCSQKVYNILKKYDNPPEVEQEELSQTKQDFHKIQHDLNPLHVLGRLKKAGVKKETLDRFIKDYEKTVRDLIYPMIID